MKAIDKLRAYYSKRERDLMLYCPLGFGTRSDASYLSGVFDKSFTDEMTSRDYDIETIKFSVEPSKGNDKFSSQRTAKTK